MFDGCFGLLFLFLLASVIIYYLSRYIWELIPLSNLRSRAVLITGCDSGFGRLLALKLAKNGITVFAGCLTEKGATDLTKDASAISNAKLETISLDVTSDKSVSTAYDHVKQSLNGRDLWAIVNNAGIFSVYGPDDWCSIDDYQRSFDVNILGVIRITQTFKPLIKISKGRIITVTSTCGRLSLPFMAPYSAAKYATEAYMDAIRQELHAFGVTCCILEPGAFRTPLLDDTAACNRIEYVWKRMNDETRKEYGGQDGKETFISLWSDTANTTSSTRVDYVVDNYYHAITSRYPRLRYRCGYDSIFLLIPASYLPTELLDYAIRLMTKKFDQQVMMNAAAKWTKKSDDANRKNQ